MQRNGQRGLLGLGALLLALFGISGYLLVQKGRAAEKDLVIQGTTGPVYGPEAPNAPRGAPNAASGLRNTSDPTSPNADGSPMNTAQPLAPKVVVVHVAGAVKKPGVYQLPPNSRAIDAVEMAGGGTAAANLNAVNLAAPLEDGSQLYIPSRAEQAQGGAQEDGPTTGASKKTRSASSKSGHGRSGKSSKAGKLATTAHGTLNINTASEKELERLPGVGPAMAAKITQFRKEFGKFTNPQELMLIPGVGEKKYAQMQPYVRVR